MHFLLLSGSFHSHSRSLAILNNVQQMLAAHQCDIPRLDQLPFFSEDLNNNKPAVVQALMQQAGQADGIIICSPEYNHSIPAVLKNAIDWLSRPAFHSVLKNKPVAIITQAANEVGGARAQAHIKLVMDSTLSRILPAHEMMIPHVQTVLDDQHSLHDASVSARLQRYLDAFATFAAQ